MTLFHKLFREWRGKRALAQLVAQTAASHEVRRYRERRAAAKKGLALKRERESTNG